MSTYTIRVRTQMLFPLNSVILALWKYQYAPNVTRLHENVPIVLRAHAYHRLNAHEGLIDFTYTTCERYERRPTISVTFRDLELRPIPDLARHLHERSKREETRLRYLQYLLDDDRRLERERNEPRSEQNEDTVTFWQTEDWWREKLSSNPTQRWWRQPEGNRHDFKRICRLLNHLVRCLVNEHGIDCTDTAVRYLMRANEQERNLLDKLYVEPAMASLFVAYLSTTFMHHKQQHGLNTKHAAAKNTENKNNPDGGSAACSARPFDPKIYLDMCSSCDKKDIFELMLSLKRSLHPNLPCDCKLCSNLCQMANAWKFYDCTDRLWLRLEFNRKFYTKVSILLNETIAVEERANDTPTLKIIYLSYKNEFTNRTNFISNFVNYYAFYENGEQPVSKFDNNRELREKISILFVFALINWQLIAKAMEANTAHNSISLNQQSIFKSLDNTLYAIFSENSINRMSKEHDQRLLNINAPYVNRGFGALPNCGINAVTTTVT